MTSLCHSVKKLETPEGWEDPARLSTRHERQAFILPCLGPPLPPLPATAGQRDLHPASWNSPTAEPECGQAAEVLSGRFSSGRESRQLGFQFPTCLMFEPSRERLV